MKIRMELEIDVDGWATHVMGDSDATSAEIKRDVRRYVLGMVQGPSWVYDLEGSVRCLESDGQ